MHRIDVGIDAAGDLIASVSAHLPPGASLGRILVVESTRILVDQDGTPAVCGLDDRGAWRVAELSCGLRELTRWLDGVETDRRILRGG